MINILLTILFSSVKFAMTFPVAVMQFEFSFFETILWTNVGGILGIYFFAFLSDKLIAWWNRNFRKSRSKGSDESGDKKVFTKRNRRIVRIKQKYGLDWHRTLHAHRALHSAWDLPCGAVLPILPYKIPLSDCFQPGLVHYLHRFLYILGYIALYQVATGVTRSFPGQF